MKTTTAQRFGSLGKSFQSPSVSAAVLGAALLASGTTDDAETAWSPSAACLLPDVLPIAGTLLSYGGNRQLAAGGTVTHSGALNIGANAFTCGAITASGDINIAANQYYRAGGEAVMSYLSAFNKFQIGTTGAIPLSLYSGGADRLLVGTNGNVGIGTSSPSNRLHIVSSSSSTTGLLVTGGSTYEGGSSSGEIRLGHSGDYGLISYGGGSGDLVFSNTYNADVGDIIFRTKTNGTPINALVITGAGAATFAGAITASGKITTSNQVDSPYFKSTTTSGYFGVVSRYAIYGGAADGSVVLKDWSTGLVPASLSCGAITASGAIQETPTQSAVDPTITDIPKGKRMGWYNSTSGEFRDWVNIGGTLKKSAAYT